MVPQDDAACGNLSEELVLTVPRSTSPTGTVGKFAWTAEPQRRDEADKLTTEKIDKTVTYIERTANSRVFYVEAARLAEDRIPVPAMLKVVGKVVVEEWSGNRRLQSPCPFLHGVWPWGRRRSSGGGDFGNAPLQRQFPAEEQNTFPSSAAPFLCPLNFKAADTAADVTGSDFFTIVVKKDSKAMFIRASEICPYRTILGADQSKQIGVLLAVVNPRRWESYRWSGNIPVRWGKECL